VIKTFIPSMGRADSRVTKGPLANIPVEHHSSVTYVVPPLAVDAYRLALDVNKMGTVAVVPCDRFGIAATRHWIGEHCAASGISKFVMMDDDIGLLVRKGPDVWNLRDPSGDEVVEMMSWIESALDTHAHVSVSAREGQNNGGVGEKPLERYNQRTLRVLAYRTTDFLSVEHGRVAVMEDFDVNLQLLRAGHSSAVSFYWAQGQRMTNEAGGCSTYRSHEVHEASAMRLAELHPGLVRLRQKENKTDREGFGTRTEVTISWKKAYEEGQKKHVRD
jgi:hypothetical protein